jgi:uncharacterized protein (TIGR00369 family)
MANRPDLEAAVESAPYGASVGMRLDAIEDDRARVRVPYKDDNSNPGRALHGGVVASAIDVAAAIAARNCFAANAGLETGAVDLAVDYLAAAIGEDIIATAQVLRRGKEIVFSQVEVRTDAGKRVAAGLVTYRVFDPAGDPGAAQRQRSTAASAIDLEPVTDKGARAFAMAPFIARLGMEVVHAHDGRCRMRMPFAVENSDADGAVHEGALAALIDSTGSLASWSITGLDLAYKASTVGIHVNYHGRALGEDVIADARTLTRNNEVFLNEVTVTGRTGRVVATGSVVYRIVVTSAR